MAVWHRRAGKDEVGLHATAVQMHKRIGNYWHLLPEAAQARKAIWDAINPITGKRRIDEAFPNEIRAATRDHEMAIRFKCGSLWQVLGSDNYNSLVGSPPIGIVYSEWALAQPQARAYLRPIITQNNGWELFIYTPRGRNHGLTTYKAAKEKRDSFAQILTAEQTGTLTPEVLEGERLAYIREYGQDEGEAFFRQEYFCDFNASLLGAILGKYVSRAEEQGRINNNVEIDPDGAPIEISSDIGFRDTASWWFWQPKVGGFSLVDHEYDSGLDASDWIARLKAKKYKIGRIWLPHDARAKTFQSKHSAIEQFLNAFGTDVMRVIPQGKISDRINAARVIMPRCEFNETLCAYGLDALREWSFEWIEDKKEFSKDPKHDWASHPGDAFSYGATVMLERVKDTKVAKPPIKGILVGNDGNSGVTLNEMWEQTRKIRESRI